MSTLAAPSSVDFARLKDTFCSQLRVEQLRAIVVGAGALGNEAVRILGLLGVGHIKVVDPDCVAATDLTRSFLLRGQIGRNKATAIKETAGVLFPDTEMVAFPCEVADVGFADLLPADVILGCTDSDLSRLELAYISTRLNIPLADGGLSTADLAAGRVSYFPGTAGACFGCLLTARRRAELLTRWQSAVGACSGPDVGDEPAYPSTPMMASVIAALQVEMALRHSKDPSAGACSWEVCIHPEPALNKLQLTRAADCPFHDPDRERLEPPGDDCTIAQYLGRAGDSAALVLDWPVCVKARCAPCGCRWAPMCRLGFFHRRAVCPECGSRQIRAEESVGELTAQSPLAAYRFSQLGLSPAHPYAVRCEDNS